MELPSSFTPDFIFIDGDHSFEGVKRDIERYIPMLSVGGYVCFHVVCFGRTGTVRALLYTIWPAPNARYYKLISLVESLLVVQKISVTPPAGFDPRDKAYRW